MSFYGDVFSDVLKFGDEYKTSKSIKQTVPRIVKDQAGAKVLHFNKITHNIVYCHENTAKKPESEP